jgi:hypothetical protein
MRCPLFVGPLRQATKQPIHARKVYVFRRFWSYALPELQHPVLVENLKLGRNTVSGLGIFRAFVPWGEAIGPDKQRDRCCQRPLASALCALSR